MTHMIHCGGWSAICDAFAWDPITGQAYFASFAGAQTAVRALAANIVKKYPERVFFEQRSSGDEEIGTAFFASTYLYPGMVRDQKISVNIARIESRLYHAVVYSPICRYDSKDQEYVLIRRPQDDPVEMNYRFLDQRCHLPLAEEWKAWLWDYGSDQGYIRLIRSEGVEAWRCAVDYQKMSEAITGAIQYGDLK